MQLSPEQQYLKDLLDTFNMNPNDPNLDDASKVLLGLVRNVQQEISELTRQVEDLNSEIRDKQEKGNKILQQVLLKQGESQGYINTLLKLRK